MTRVMTMMPAAFVSTVGFTHVAEPQTMAEEATQRLVPHPDEDTT
jgi:hypothetical protein